MTQSQLDRAVARATGESIATIRRHGFSVMQTATAAEREGPTPPQMVDWEALDATRLGLLPQSRKCQRIAS